MRKVLSFVLVLSLVLGSFGMAFAATTTTPTNTKLSDIAGKDCEDAVRVLAELDVVSGYADGTYKPEATVTRAEMASLIIKALGLKETNAIPKFTDSQTHWAKGYIAYANTLGIISGRTATAFDPDATVTYDEATTMLVKALGYTDEALVGVYPASYVSRARVLGILDSVKTGSGAANRGDIAVMLYQTVDQAIGKVDKDGNFQETVTKYDKDGKAKEYDTMLARLGAEVTTMGASGNGAKVKISEERPDVDEHAFLVTGDENSLINLTPYKGGVVSAYVNKDYDIIAIKEVFTTFVSGTFNDAKAALDTDTVFTLADGTEYTFKQDAVNSISSGAVKFVNGDEKAFDVDTQTQYTLATEVSGKKVTEVYSVMRWDVDADDVIDASDVSDISKNHKLLGVEFDEDNNGEIDLTTFNLVGVDSLSDLKADMVVYVSKNEDGYISKVAVGPTEKVTGEATKVSSGDNDSEKVTVNGKVYKYATAELKGNKGPGEVDPGKIEAGDEVEITLDAYGYIYDSEKTDSKADKFAVVLKTGFSGGVDSDPQIKLLLADGSTKLFTAKAGDIDNANAITSSSIGWNPTLTSGSIVKYGVNKDGKITSLQVADGGTDKDLSFRTANSSINSKGYFNGREISKNAVLFNYDPDENGVAFVTASGNAGVLSGGAMDNDEDAYAIASYNSILDIDALDANYVYDSKNQEIVAMVLNNASSSKDVYAVIRSASKNNSDAGAEYVLYIDGKEVTYNGSDSDNVFKAYDTASRAALYRVKFDSQGDVSGFSSWKDKNEVKSATLKVDADHITDKAIQWKNNTFSITSGTAMTLDGYNASQNKDDKTSISVDRDAVVYVYDKSGNTMKWSIGSTSDIKNLVKGDKITFYETTDDYSDPYNVVLIEKAQ